MGGLHDQVVTRRSGYTTKWLHDEVVTELTERADFIVKRLHVPQANIHNSQNPSISNTCLAFLRFAQKGKRREKMDTCLLFR